MVKYRACHVVISDMDKNDAGKGAGIVGERESVMGLFIICLLMCLLKNRHQASWCHELITFHTAWPCETPDMFAV